MEFGYLLPSVLRGVDVLWTNELEPYQSKVKPLMGLSCGSFSWRFPQKISTKSFQPRKYQFTVPSTGCVDQILIDSLKRSHVENTDGKISIFLLIKWRSPLIIRLAGFIGIISLIFSPFLGQNRFYHWTTNLQLFIVDFCFCSGLWVSAVLESPHVLHCRWREDRLCDSSVIRGDVEKVRKALEKKT